MKKEFSTLEVVKALKIDRERLRDWMTRSFIVPSVSADGKGTKAIFTVHDIYGIELFRFLLNAGLSRSSAASYVNFFMKKDKAGRTKTAYIKFMVDTEGKVSLAQTLPEGDWKHDYKTGLTTEGSEDAKTRSHEPENEFIANQKWGIVQIIYFEQLRQKVDLALSRL